MDKVNYVMEQSDYVVLVMPLTPETRHFISHEAFQHSKKDQVFINIGRGPLLNEDALYEALVSGAVAGAALDVFSTEPLPAESPLWGAPNLIISPHNADQTIDFRHQSVRFFCENCERFINGEDLEAIIDKRAGY
jgi:phosphoglycerate dehydrogenase-like enzyme